MDDQTARIDAIAAKALMLERGEFFTVGVEGTQERATEKCQEIGDSIERQFDAAAGLMPWLASPDSLGIAVARLRPHQSTIVIGRAHLRS